VKISRLSLTTKGLQEDKDLRKKVGKGLFDAVYGSPENQKHPPDNIHNFAVNSWSIPSKLFYPGAVPGAPDSKSVG
jgi:hypothetical protein